LDLMAPGAQEVDDRLRLTELDPRVLRAMDDEQRAPDLVETADRRARQHVGIVRRDVRVARIGDPVMREQFAHERQKLLRECAKIRYASIVDRGGETIGRETGADESGIAAVRAA